MSAMGNTKSSAARVESVLRTPDSATWIGAPAGLHDRVMASLDAHPARGSSLDPGASRFWRWSWGQVAAAASVAIIAGGLGVFAGAVAWRSVPADSVVAAALPKSGHAASETVSEIAGQRGERPAAVLTRAFEELRPAGSSRFVASVAAPMRTEVEGLASETRLAARTVLARLPFVSVE